MSIVTLGNSNSFNKVVLQSKKLSIVIFSATWCAPCKILKETLKEVLNELENTNKLNKINFVLIDIDDHLNLAKEYNVRSVPTIMIFANHELKEEIKGTISKAKFLEIINLYLAI